MNKLTLLVTMIIVAFVLAACETGDASTDSAAAQSLQPAPNGFSQEVANDLVENFAAVVATGAGATGNVPLAAALERVNTTLRCLEDTGAVSAVIYRQEDFSIIPQAGVSLIVNQTRVERNILNCVTNLPFETQGLEDVLQPCADSGNFTNEGEEYFYAYVGAGDSFCTQMSSYYVNLAGSSR